MSASKLFAAGYTQICSVIPPGAELSPDSRIKPELLGKIPGRKGSKGWAGYKFLTDLPTSEDAAKWDRDGANVGLLAAHYPAIDIDSDSPGLVKTVLALAEEILGSAPERLSVGERRLLVYRAADPFARMALVVTHKEKSHLIECLGEGRQYLVSGTHPSGARYRWAGDPLWEFEPDDLTWISREDVVRFFDALEQGLAARGIEVERIGDGSTPTAPPVQEGLLAPSIEELGRIVALIPNDTEDRDDYVRVGMAIKAAGAEDPEAAFLVWASWCDRWTGGTNDPDEVRLRWDGFSGPFKAGFHWLLELAEASGYQSAQDEFEALDDSPPPAPAPVLDKRLIDYTDEWAVAQVLPALSEQLKYLPGEGDRGTWLVWSGYRWEVSRDLEHERRARAELTKLALQLEDQALAAPNKQQRTPKLKAAQRFQSSNGISSAVKLLRAKVACTEDQFDLDLYSLNTPDGLLDLRSGEIVPPNPGTFLRRSVLVAPQKRDMPLWLQFLRDLTGGDVELQRYLQKVCGYALTGDVGEKALWFIWGSDSDTGKSTFVRVLQALLGDYADSVSIAAFVGKGERIPADLARLPGVRLVTATEPAAGTVWQEETIKSVTGNDKLNARFLYGQWFNYVPQFKILVVGNHSPSIANVDDAMLRRIHIVPFNRKVPREKQITDLSDRVVAEEGPAVMQWLLEGCLLWQQEGLLPPEAVTQRTLEYREEEDVVQQWIDAECELDPEAQTSRSTLYQSWAEWCRMRDEKPGGDRTFKSKMDPKKKQLNLIETQIGKTSSSRVRGYRGIRLRSRVDEAMEEFTQ